MIKLSCVLVFLLASVTGIWGQAKTRRLPSIINHPSLNLYAPYISFDGDALLFISDDGEDQTLTVFYTSRENDWNEPVVLPKNALTPAAQAELVPVETIFARWRKLPTGYRIVTGLGGLTLAGITIMAALNRVRGGAAPKAESGLTLNTVSS